MNDKLLSFLGLTRKSGNLFLGMDCVKDNILKKKILLVLVSSDISEKSFKKINFICLKNNIKTITINYTMEDLSITLGRKTAIIGISDENFKNKIISIITTD